MKSKYFKTETVQTGWACDQCVGEVQVRELLHSASRCRAALVGFASCFV